MAGTAVNLAQDAIKLSGKDPIHTFCKPAPKNHKVDRYTPKEKPELWQAFIKYGIRDVETLRTIYKMLPKGNHAGIERTLWELDTRINERGVRVDLDLVHAALRAIEAEKTRLNARVAELTGGVIGAASQRDRLREYLIELGADLPDLTAATVEEALKNEALPEVARELLQIRQQISKASTAKYQTILAAHDENDHRLRGMLQINGASRTGRYSGRLVQLQNLPRPKMKGGAIEKALPLIKDGREREVTDNVMQLCSDLIRSVLVPAPGNKFVCVDLSNVEGRVLAWLADEESAMEDFRAFDRGDGEDMYIVTYARSFGVDPKTVTPDQRQLGKAMVLAFGFGGGLGAMVSAADIFRLDLHDLVEPAFSAASDDLINRAEKSLKWAQDHNKTYDLDDDVVIACSILKLAFRDSRPETAKLWRECEQASKQAFSAPDQWFKAGKHLQFCYGRTKFGSTLIMRLPSGRDIYHHNPKWKPAEKEEDDFGDDRLTFMSVEQGKWKRVYTYGGSMAQTATQAAARDVMMHTFPLIEAYGYRIVLSVHDEVLTETPDDPRFNEPELASLLATNPPWAEELPLAAAGWEGYFYRK
jgi:DNA polymerase